MFNMDKEYKNLPLTEEEKKDRDRFNTLPLEEQIQELKTLQSLVNNLLKKVTIACNKK
jgi:hypothetical protein